MKDFNIWVDFNDVIDGRVDALRSHVRGGLNIEGPPLVVVAGDDDGNRALARVVSVSGDVVTLALVKRLPPVAAPEGGEKR